MKKQTKFLMAATASMVMSLSTVFTGMAATGWVDNGTNWVYYSTDGTLASNQWVKSGDYMYWIQPNGVMGTNMWINNNEKWYYMGEDGASVKGWKEINGKWYFFYDDFTMAASTMVDSYRVGRDGAWVQN